MTVQTVWVVQAFNSEGATYNKAFGEELDAINHYRAIIEETHVEFTKDNGEDFQFKNYEEIDNIYCVVFDSEKFSERIEITTLEVN